MTDMFPVRALNRRWLPSLSTRRLADLCFTLLVGWALLVAHGSAQAQAKPAVEPLQITTVAGPRTGDYIVAVVNSELVTAGELETRLARVREDAQRTHATLPPESELRRQVLDALIEERVLVTYARDNANKVDDADLDRAVLGVAQQNKLTLDQLRERMKLDGIDQKRFREQLRDQIMVERVREHEVQGRIEVSDKEIDDFLAAHNNTPQNQIQYNIAQILISVPDGATTTEVAEKEARARTAQRRVAAGEDFAAVARDLSDDGNHASGGAIGLKPADRLPDVFVAAVRSLQPGQVAPDLLRTGAGFHLLKLLARTEGKVTLVTQTRARHILLRPSANMPQDVAIRRLAEFKQQIIDGSKFFDQLAREYSEDGSAPQGGDLGWQPPGALVPEFEDAMNKLPINGISDPVVSRFGVHLIQVLERRQVSVEPKQLREQARNAIKEKKFEGAYADWIKDLRAKAFVEMREPPNS